MIDKLANPPTSFLGYKFTAQGLSLRVCAHCEKEKGEFQAVKNLAAGLPITHGICTVHYAQMLDGLKVG
jgi:hypothetical protein